MHRTTPVPRSLWRTFVLGLALAAGAGTLCAQEGAQPPAKQETKARVETVPAGTTKRLAMSSGAVIAKVMSENPKVIRVETIPNDATAVLVTGLNTGSSRVTFIDVKNGTEIVDVVVPDTNQAALALEKKRTATADLIRAVAPTAVVTVIPTGNDGTVILSGTLASTDQVQTVLEAARSFFPIVINHMRVGGVQQVEVHVVVAVVNRSEIRTLNFSFIQEGRKQFIASVLGGPFAFTSTLFSNPVGDPASRAVLASDPANLVFGITGSQNSFNGFLQALRNENLAKILADSRQVTFSGQPGVINSGGRAPTVISSTAGNPEVRYEQFGTIVNFLPIVQGDGKIFLQLTAELSALNEAISLRTPTIQAPGFSARFAKSAVQLEDGQTLAIGGLIQNTVNATTSKVPLLGDLPGVGLAFRRVQFTEIEEELLILVTPRLVDGVACCQIPKYLPGRETRSPDDFELFLEGILEAPRGPRVVGNHPKTYQAAHKLNNDGYPCAGGACAAGNCQAGVSTAVHTQVGGISGVQNLTGARVPTSEMPPRPLAAGAMNNEIDRPTSATRDADVAPVNLETPAAPLPVGPPEGR